MKLFSHYSLSPLAGTNDSGFAGGGGGRRSFGRRQRDHPRLRRRGGPLVGGGGGGERHQRRAKRCECECSEGGELGAPVHFDLAVPLSGAVPMRPNAKVPAAAAQTESERRFAITIKVGTTQKTEFIS